MKTLISAWSVFNTGTSSSVESLPQCVAAVIRARGRQAQYGTAFLFICSVSGQEEDDFEIGRSISVTVLI